MEYLYNSTVRTSPTRNQESQLPGYLAKLIELAWLEILVTSQRAREDLKLDKTVIGKIRQLQSYLIKLLISTSQAAPKTFRSL